MKFNVIIMSCRCLMCMSGWKAVEEYLSDDLAENSEDEKRIRQAQARASRKRKLNSHQPKRPRNRDVAFTPSTRPSSDFFRGYQQKYRQEFGSTGNQVWYPRAAPKPTDYCFNCSKVGHWRRNCPEKPTSSAKEGTSSQQWR